MLLGPSVEVVENSRQLATRAAQSVAGAAVLLDHAGIPELRETGREDRRADRGPPPQVREGQGIPTELPDQAQGPAPAEQLQSILNGPSRSH